MSGKSEIDEDAADAVFKALSSRTRRRMVDLLRDHPRTTGDLCAQIDELDRCTVMQHLRVLEQAGLVVAVRHGRERWNHLDVLPIVAIERRWLGDYARPSAELLAVLDERMS